jgi:diguanylate cyclase (GGDEF)-like protein
MPELKPKVLLVDDDPGMLLLLTKWLGPVNYEIRTAPDAREGIASIQTDCPDMLITDWDMPGMSGLQLVAWLRQQELPRYVFTLLLTVRCGKSDIVQGFEAGVDEFLRKPIDKDELIARMLSGKRVIQLEQQLRALARTDALTGLMNRPTFLSQLEMEWGRCSRLPIPMCCVMLEVDHYAELKSSQGQHAAEQLLKNIAQTLQANTRVSDGVCRYGDGRIAVLLAEATETNAVLWADRVRSLAAAKHATQLSFGLAERNPTTQSHFQLIEKAEQALLHSQTSGSGQITAASQLQAPAPNLSATVTNLFANLSAREVMSPVVPRLSLNDNVARVLSFFLRFHFTEAPVVDGTRQFAGMLAKRDLMAATLQNDWQSGTIRELVHSEATRFQEDTNALEIYGHFCRSAESSVVILRDGRPVGLVHRTALLNQLTQASEVRNANSAVQMAPVNTSMPTQTC